MSIRCIELFYSDVRYTLKNLPTEITVTKDEISKNLAKNYVLPYVVEGIKNNFAF